MATLFFLIFLLISVIGYINWSFTDFLDKGVWHYINNLRTNEATIFFKFITFFGNSSSLGFFVALVTIYLVIIKKDYFSAFILDVSAVVGALFLNDEIKDFYKRLRPFKVGDIDSLVEASNFSYPSGHSMGAAIIYTLAIYILLKNVKSSIIKKICYVVTLIFILVIALSRVYLGVHYPTDIIAGFSLGISFAISMIIFMKKYTK